VVGRWRATSMARKACRVVEREGASLGNELVGVKRC
jgi:hypothetical protein